MIFLKALVIPVLSVAILAAAGCGVSTDRGIDPQEPPPSVEGAREACDAHKGVRQIAGLDSYGEPAVVVCIDGAVFDLRR